MPNINTDNKDEKSLASFKNNRVAAKKNGVAFYISDQQIANNFGLFNLFEEKNSEN